MKTYEQFYINGEWVDPVDGKNMFDVLNPSNEEVIGQIAMGSAADVDNEDCVGKSLLQIWKLRFYHNAKPLFRF